MLLVVTNKTDLASDYLILRLKERDVPFRRLNTEDFGTRFWLEIAVGAGPDFSITMADGKVIQKSVISAVYFRQPRAPHVPDDVAVSDRTFVRQELKESLRSLWRVIDADKWLNHPRNLWLASNKIEQLTVAATMGFAIPETCVTTSQDSLRAFYEDHDGRVICKAVKHGFSHEDNVVTLAMTRRVEREFVDGFGEYAAVPMIFQREIMKACDVRVTVVAENVFATAIHSQERSETEVDWRLWDVSSFDLRHEAIRLPSRISGLCQEITAHFGLKYAAIDLALGADGAFYFLELNPNGQWAWIEQKVGYPVRDAIIDCLAVRSPACA